MNEFAFLFSGQGAQTVGMGKTFYEAYSETREIYDIADDILGYKISSLCFNGPKGELDKTDKCQPAILTTGIAVLSAFKAKTGIRPAFCAGLSLGEFTALVACGALKFEDALRLVDIRGKLMQESAEREKGAMSAIIGLNEDILRSISEDTGIELANFNSPGQIVISGKLENIEKAESLCKERGAKRIIRLAVSGAFHCSILKGAQEKLNEEIDKVLVKDPLCPFYSSITGQRIISAADVRSALKRQLVSPTLWQKAMEALSAETKKFVEFAPAGTLKGMMRRIDKAASVSAINTIEDLDVFHADEMFSEEGNAKA